MEEILNLQNKDEGKPSLSSPEVEQMSIEDAGKLSRPRTIAEHLVYERHPRFLARVHSLLISLSPFERLALYVFTATLSFSTLWLVISLSTQVSTSIPSYGGTLTEGAVGTPRFINPLLAISQTDQDISTLVYSGLMRVNRDGDVITDLAERYEVSDDGTQYIFHLKPYARFHDGKTVTAEDVEFTILLAQSPEIKSPRRADWEGVSVKTEDEHTIIFTLPHPYAPFLENMQLGILPKHLWENIPADEFPFHVLNTKPIGSGPYKIENISTNDAGTPLSYTLKAFSDFTLGRPYIQTITFRFFSNEQSLIDGFAAKRIDSFAGIAPERIPLDTRTDTRLVRAPSTRIFAVFFNQNHAPTLADSDVREALSAGIDRTDLVSAVLSGYGRPAFGPIPPSLLSSPLLPIISTTTTSASERARHLLELGNWKFSTPTSTSTPDEKSVWKKKDAILSFAISTADTPELVATANKVADTWRAAGIDVSVQVYPLTEFNTTVLRPRSYDAVLFGEVIGRSLDLFAFWHSSQRNDPGLNFSLYANSSVDKELASARAELNRSQREKLYTSFAETIANDNPAVFLYSPDFVYIVPSTVQNLSLGALTTPAERFLNVYEWYTDTERVWDVFAK